MNSLEDAFVNIGMDEEKFLNKEAKDAPDTKEKYTDFSDIQIPAILSQPPSFNFFQQCIALFLRKFHVTIRSISIVISFFFPIIYLIFAIVICDILQKNWDNPIETPNST